MLALEHVKLDFLLDPAFLILVCPLDSFKIIHFLLSPEDFNLPLHGLLPFLVLKSLLNILLFLYAQLFQLLYAHLLIFGHLFVDVLYLEVFLFFVLLFYLNSFLLLLLDLVQPLLSSDHRIHDLLLPLILYALRLIKYFLHVFFLFLRFFVRLIALLLPYFIKHSSFFN